VLHSPDAGITLSLTEFNNGPGRTDLETFAELTNALYGTGISAGFHSVYLQPQPQLRLSVNCPTQRRNFPSITPAHGPNASSDVGCQKTENASDPLGFPAPGAIGVFRAQCQSSQSDTKPASLIVAAAGLYLRLSAWPHTCHDCFHFSGLRLNASA